MSGDECPSCGSDNVQEDAFVPTDRHCRDCDYDWTVDEASE
jgi:uncharacterized protein (DUF983 family)